MALGIFGGVLAVIWEFFSLLGLSQSILDFKLGLLSLNDPFRVMPFSLASAITLIVLWFIGWYVVGLIFGTIFNKFAK